MNTFEKYAKKANTLIEKLQRQCTDQTICENYGQKAINKFIDKISLNADYQDLYYEEQCNIKDILYKVSSITPNK